MAAFNLLASPQTYGLGKALAGVVFGTGLMLVIAAGGRHYLAKDAFYPPEVIRAGYPRLEEWKAIRHRVDPDGLWVSDQARRLELI